MREFEKSTAVPQNINSSEFVKTDKYQFFIDISRRVLVGKNRKKRVRLLNFTNKLQGFVKVY